MIQIKLMKTAKIKIIVVIHILLLNHQTKIQIHKNNKNNHKFQQLKIIIKVKIIRVLISIYLLKNLVLSIRNSRIAIYHRHQVLLNNYRHLQFHHLLLHLNRKNKIFHKTKIKINLIINKGQFIF